MNKLVFKSLEQLLKTCFIVFSILLLVLWVILGFSQQWSAVNVSLSGVAIAISLWLCFSYVYRRTLVAFRRASMHLEAVENNDFCQYAKPAFVQGQVKDFHQDLEYLSSHLQLLKSRYDQHIFLVYRLIEQLESPVLVFDQHPQLTYANSAFNELFPQPWQIFRHSSPGLLGLEFVGNHWRFKDEAENNKWQVRHSEFIEQGKNHLLLVFINIELALRESQLNAWQQLIRVLGHEIHNSLTPVSALAQGLSVKSENERDKQALNVITERCKHLQEFVSRYASISKPFHLNCQEIPVGNIVKRIQGLFKDTAFIFEQHIESFWADPAFIEQVLLNIVKNAIEASKADAIIKVVFSESDSSSIIEVIDSGHGFANLNNLFVPLYSTKQNGQGIGLSFCRNIIEHHKGSIALVNNADAPGVTVSIYLPINA